MATAKPKQKPRACVLCSKPAVARNLCAEHIQKKARRFEKRFRASKEIAPRACWLCDEPAIDGSLCVHHREARLEYKRKQPTRAYQRGHYRCCRCGALGHNVQRCPVVVGTGPER